MIYPIVNNTYQWLSGGPYRIRSPKIVGDGHGGWLVEWYGASAQSGAVYSPGSEKDHTRVRSIGSPYNVVGVSGTEDTRLKDTYVGPHLVGPTAQHGTYTHEFMHYGSRVSHTVAVKSSIAYARVKVDGQYVTGIQSAGNNATQGFIGLDFQGVRAARHIEFEISHGAFISEVWADPTDTIWAPEWRPTRKIYFMGDSYTDGSIATTNGFDDMVHIAARRLGMTDCTVDALGGTGYVKVNGAASFPNYLTRAPSNLGSGLAMPDVIVVCGSINDSGYTTEVQTNAAALFSFFADNVPDAKVFSVLFTGQYPIPAGMVAPIAGVKAAAAAAPNHYGVLDLSLVLTGTGNVGSPNGTGNSDYIRHSDGAHPTQAGHDIYGRLISDWLAELL